MGWYTLASKSVGALRRVGFNGQRRLRSMGLETVKDLLQHYPRKYIDRSSLLPIRRLRVGEEATIVATVEKVTVKRPRPKLSILTVTVSDDSGVAECIWFNQDFRASDFSEGDEVAFSGKVERFGYRLQLSNPSYDVLSYKGISDSLEVGRIVPVYPASLKARVSSGYLRRLIWEALETFADLEDPLPEAMRKELALLDRARALRGIHFPDSFEHLAQARRRLVVDEVFSLQVALRLLRNTAEEDKTAIRHPYPSELAQRFLLGLPYRLTSDQSKALAEIASDMAAGRPMHRLLQGEVGSGKTVVAAAAICIAVSGGHQAAFMAPTEVLAGQHYFGLRPYLESQGLRVRLLTSGIGAPRRKAVLEEIRSGRVDVVVGTHSLFQEDVEFASLGLVIVDEQHRFGVHQRLRLREKAPRGIVPDVLIMTATPIPRTAALTFYGDLDVSTIEELPQGRKPVDTKILEEPHADEAYLAIREEVSRGRQAYVVCPLIEESDKLEASAAEEVYDQLAYGPLAGLRLGLLHGRMPPAEREAQMAAFRAGEVDVLVATTIVEVGVDVPNATVMAIMSAERFGLAQLHQLRGRVGRGSVEGKCYLIASNADAARSERLRALVHSSSGMELAEEDLRIRGEGTVFGARQTGRTDLKLTRLVKDAPLIARCKEWAVRLLEEDPLLEAHPALKREIESIYGEDLQVASGS
ncbi:MAG: DNA helicase RecG [Acidimicrobiia bacterium]